MTNYHLSGLEWSSFELNAKSRLKPGYTYANIRRKEITEAVTEM